KASMKKLINSIQITTGRIAPDKRAVSGVQMLKAGMRRGSRSALDGAVKTYTMAADRLAGRPKRTVPLILGLCLVLATGFSVLITVHTRRQAARRAAIEVSTKPPAEGRAAMGLGLVADARNLLTEGDITNARTIADSILTTDPDAHQGLILQGQISIRSGRYDEAERWFQRVKRLRGGNRAVARTLPLILVDVGHQLVRGQAPASLIDLAVRTLEAANSDIVRAWTTDKRYWLRWGAVSIREAQSLPYDTVAVYLLDLKHAGSARTRRTAARKLGELGDPRAVPALEEARNKGLADPFVSPTAAAVLKEKFGK
ncbi:MAG: hypothetical protein GF344_05025, partial [Chitinivibrionales bacterium]|nr:hypothetical protein [Chitinivibrionales bacterium]MBD3356363.1 hypothetical protein [Chitinivibrionales bacterium]